MGFLNNNFQVNLASLGCRSLPVVAAVAAALAISTTYTSPAEAGGRGIGTFGAGVAVGVIGGALLRNQGQARGRKQRSSRQGSSRRNSTKRSRSAASSSARNDVRVGGLTIREVKRALVTLGLMVSASSDAKDDTYKVAVQEYQRSKKLVPNGVLDDTQVELLSQEADARASLKLLTSSGETGAVFIDPNKRWQAGLKVLGYYNGPIDGDIGRGTKRSTRSYQAASGAVETGVLTPIEIDQLAQKAKANVEHKLAGINSQFALLSQRQLAALKGSPVVAGSPHQQVAAAAPYVGSAAPAIAPTLAHAAPTQASAFAPIDPIKPSAEVKRPTDVAVIIGNRDYKGKDIPAVEFGLRDAEAMKSLLINELGFSVNNIIDARDAGQAELISIFGSKDNNRGKVWRLIDPDGKSNVYVFYSGHGAPEVASKTPYLMPVDAHPDTIELNGYPLEQMYVNLESLEVQSVAVFIDACFSGGSQRGMLTQSASPVAVTAKMPATKDGDRLTVLAAAEGDQLASWDEKAGFGMFTESLIRGLKGEADSEGDGRITAKELHKFVHDDVRRSARRQFGRIQTPVLLGNSSLIVN